MFYFNSYYVEFSKISCLEFSKASTIVDVVIVSIFLIALRSVATNNQNWNAIIHILNIVKGLFLIRTKPKCNYCKINLDSICQTEIKNE